jgi:hypothetical protein
MLIMSGGKHDVMISVRTSMGILENEFANAPPDDTMGKMSGSDIVVNDNRMVGFKGPH